MARGTAITHSSGLFRRSLSTGLLLFLVAGLAVCFLACNGNGDSSQATPVSVSGTGLSISSPAFQDGDPIPAKYTCDGEDVSPPLEWSNVPDGTESIALIVDDPDAPGGTFVHWVFYDLPEDSDGLAEGISTRRLGALGGSSGSNNLGESGYGGPCPPRGDEHRYFFRLYSLDGELGLESGATKSELFQAMEGRVLDQAELMGTYQRGGLAQVPADASAARAR